MKPIAKELVFSGLSRRISISNSTDSFVSFVDSYSIEEKAEVKGTSERPQHANEPKKILPRRDIESLLPLGYYGDLTRPSQINIIEEMPYIRTRSPSPVIEPSHQTSSHIRQSSKHRLRRFHSVSSLTPSELNFLKPQTFLGFMAECFGKFAGWIFNTGAPGYASGVARYHGRTRTEAMMDRRTAGRSEKGRDELERSGL